MLIYCRDCLLEGVLLADSPSHGTIHEGRAICIWHLRQAVDDVIRDRIPLPMMAEAGAQAGVTRC